MEYMSVYRCKIIFYDDFRILKKRNILSFPYVKDTIYGISEFEVVTSEHIIDSLLVFGYNFIKINSDVEISGLLFRDKNIDLLIDLNHDDSYLSAYLSASIGTSKRTLDDSINTYLFFKEIVLKGIRDIRINDVLK